MQDRELIYLIHCKKCGHQYVGETGQALHCRMNNHQADVIHKRKRTNQWLHISIPKDIQWKTWLSW